ncbi:MAG TPA: large conductance mechanosensitive channel protein MscL [Candidatus Aphodoplasma excrementigallinarum]|uniref:Large-conductance mechanosensitive channel n=1 Tax=Candidatus Aphodoplasma excrementigallinarum TaxID=2840673 RepID=A0A9D1NG23_9FIRM|nr:large conductance mechanosensitive channel protein MscL [Candidatus Aphodoplasma excrementigallinarum]
MKKFWQEFKAFALKGNVVEMAVGVIIGTAFSAIVNSLVKDLITPLFGIILGGIKFDSLSVQVGDSVITYGNFIQSVVNFLIISLTIFLFIKLSNKIFHRKEEIKKEEAAKKSEEVLLLEDIRDSLRAIEQAGGMKEDKAE